MCSCWGPTIKGTATMTPEQQVLLKTGRAFFKATTHDERVRHAHRYETLCRVLFAGIRHAKDPDRCGQTCTGCFGLWFIFTRPSERRHPAETRSPAAAPPGDP